MVLGGGVGLVCVCDMVVVVESVSFFVSEVWMGILLVVIGFYFVNVVGLCEVWWLVLIVVCFGVDEVLCVGFV